MAKDHFERWVPPGAKRRIKDLRTQIKAPAHLQILDRLANSPIMQTEVWEKSAAVRRRADEIIDWTFRYARAAANFVPPPPKGKREFEQWELANRDDLSRHRDLGSVAAIADMLSKAMIDTNDDAVALLPFGVSVDKMRAHVLQIQETYAAIAQHQADLDRRLSVYRPRKARSANVRETVFAVSMSDKLRQMFGRPCDDLITALTSVVFNLSDGPGVTTIRGRRRSASRPASRPAHSEKKPT